MENLSDEALKTILLTVDGRGKVAKEKVLEELLNREYDKALSDVHQGMSTMNTRKRVNRE